MTRSGYKVSYHLIQIVYLPKGEAVPAGETYAKIWTAAGCFGKKKVRVCFFPEENPSAAPRRQPLRTLGSLDAIGTLLESPQTVFLGGASSQPKEAALPTIDYDFLLDLATSGHHTFHLAVSNQWLGEVSEDAVESYLRFNFDLLDQWDAPYGFIDLSHSRDACAGFVYTGPRVEKMSMRRCCEDLTWRLANRSGVRTSRGIFWGNYFGAEMLKKLGGQKFVDEYRELTRDSQGTPGGDALIWEFEKGLFVSLSRKPYEPSRVRFLSMARVRFLSERMTAAGIL